MGPSANRTPPAGNTINRMRLLAAENTLLTALASLQPDGAGHAAATGPGCYRTSDSEWTKQENAAAANTASIAWQRLLPDQNLQELIRRSRFAHNQDPAPHCWLRAGGPGCLMTWPECCATADDRCSGQQSWRQSTCSLPTLNASGCSVVAGDQQVFVGPNSWEPGSLGPWPVSSEAALGNYLALECHAACGSIAAPSSRSHWNYLGCLAQSG